MIIEALKSKNMQDFGIPTPDEKLRSELGDETYGKIQSLDKEQADIMKQSFDPNYPRDLKQETIQSFMESHGFDLEIDDVEYVDRTNDIYKIELYIPDDTSKAFSINYGLTTYDYLPNKRYIFYDYTFIINKKSIRKNGSIEIHNMFDLDMGNYYGPNEEDIKTISMHILIRIKNELEKILGVSK